MGIRDAEGRQTVDRRGCRGVGRKDLDQISAALDSSHPGNPHRLARASTFSSAGDLPVPGCRGWQLASGTVDRWSEFCPGPAAQWRLVADQLRPKALKLATLMDESQHDTIHAYMTFPQGAPHQAPFYQPARTLQRRDQATYQPRWHLPQRRRHHLPRRRRPPQAERRVGRLKQIHDTGIHRSRERQSNRRVARRRGGDLRTHRHTFHIFGRPYQRLRSNRLGRL